MRQTDLVVDARVTEHGSEHDDGRHDGDEQRVERAVRFVAAPPEAVFDLLADPSKHTMIDGSGTVRGPTAPAPRRLEPGAKFEMSMRVGVPYRIVNEVVEFEEPKLIGWRHKGGHIWRWRLRPVDGGTEVTEEFDWRPSRVSLFLRATRSPQRNATSIQASLDRLADHFQNPTP